MCKYFVLLSWYRIRVMEMLKSSVFAILLVFALLVHGQDQSGFISLDCGLPRNESYKETSGTDINYISDAPFIKTGISNSIAPEYKAYFQDQLFHLRSFPDGIRNCYTVNVTRGTRYLIRASFLHGNYDGQNTVPQFDLHLGANFWATVKDYKVNLSNSKEIIHVPLQDYARVCLVNTGSGTPFISALEFRPLRNDTYVVTSGSLALTFRFDMGSNNDVVYRYPTDVFDRMWEPYTENEWTQLNTSHVVNPGKNYQPPSVVMMTAAMPKNGSSHVDMHWNALDPRAGIVGDEFYVYMHFAELQELETNEFRAFDIAFNGDVWYEGFVPDSSQVITISKTSPSISTNGKYNFSLIQLENSTLPPIINAFEVFSRMDTSQSETDQDDVEAITNIRSNYGMKRNWDGDPCVPVSFIWEGLNCSNDGFDLPRIISLNLSSSGLTGEITSYISKLTMIQSLDLSNNSLTGSVPDFLSKFPNLRILNLEKNNLTGSVPVELVERSKSGSLSLSVGENVNLCASDSCNKKKKSNPLIPISASIGALVALLIAVAILVAVLIRRKQAAFINAKSYNQNDPFESRKRQFSYAEVMKITNNFEKVLGKGGSALVYYGLIDDSTPVAVKMLSLPSVQGSQNSQLENDTKQEHNYQQFLAEVKLLMTVYHGNLTSLVGYCNEGTNMGLIYEYMANGDLESHLSGKKANVLSWETRLRIAIDAAQGLEYLHDGCKPPIIHRDVKTANILLTENFRAKLADFGLSRFFANDGSTHISTIHIAGTPGYLDPDITNNSWLNEKSDVFSFGVVLLQIITSRPAICRTNEENPHISQWVRFTLANGDITSIVDPRLEGNFEINSVSNAVKIAMACVSLTSNLRPGMSQVVTELKNCLAEELSAGSIYSSAIHESTSRIEFISLES